MTGQKYIFGPCTMGGFNPIVERNFLDITQPRINSRLAKKIVFETSQNTFDKTQNKTGRNEKRKRKNEREKEKIVGNGGWLMLKF